MEHITIVANGKCRRRLSPEHALFAAGNALRMSKYYQSMGLDALRDEMEDDDDDDAVAYLACRLGHCHGVGFASVRAYEEHYDLIHRNVCHACGQSFLSARLLDLHVSETHDAFFRVLAKRQPMYACLVDGCPQVFKHDDERTKHLVADHQYPPNFAFRRPRRPPSTPPTTTKPERMHDDRDVDAIKIAKAHARKLKRREKKKQEARELKHAKNEEVNDEPMDDTQESGTADDSTMQDASDVRDLVQRMKQLMVPRSVSFGRRAHQRR